ncbi:ankyrin repeat domain-containing protein [Aspergillus glaucus CBS 516.65]|uniref:Uncharacterized protein n=1 Tax=Aspergillus glaucus CBS 516.65 TaxID=1160497 RepID=A0A1L9VPT0_ASPGL|nr:hypothetical protein ASPGLDRAFT_1293849 [Aspergillus glaucus CBS 516.65]OJJ85927.1 hypothetical protein ASPGLDRAFT_1293849 [Aspergillus glaucus CBS 516.65]
MISVCAGLVTMDEQTHVIRLVHHTTQEYFERTCQTWFSNAHHNIAQTCLTYLGYDFFESGTCVSYDDLKLRLQAYPLYSYSSINLGYHVRHQPVDTEFFLESLTSNNKVSACSQVLLSARAIGWSQRLSKDVSLVHLVAWPGLEDILHDLIEIGIPCNSEDSNKRTPLFWAATNGQEGMARKLLEAGADPDNEDLEAHTPLFWAAENGQDAIIRLLLQYNANPDNKGNSGSTSLWRAARFGRVTTMKPLLEAGDNPEHKATPSASLLCPWHV